MGNSRNQLETHEEKRRVTKEAYQSLYEFIHDKDPTLRHVGLVRVMSEESGNVEWVLEENEEKWKEREREEMMKREKVREDPFAIFSSPSSSNMNVVGVEDQKLRDEEQDGKIQEMEEQMKIMMEMFQNQQQTMIVQQKELE